MLNSSIFHLTRLVILLVIFASSTSLFAVTAGQDGTLISFRADNESVRSVLQRLSVNHWLNITFNASNEDFDATINYRAEDKRPETILAEILSLIRYEYSSIGNQLVVHRSERFEQLSQEGLVSHVDTVLQIVEIPVVVYDTIKMYQTKTEIVYRTQPYTTFVRPLVINRPLSQPLRVRHERFSVSLSYAQILAGFRYTDAMPSDEKLLDVRNADGSSFRNYMITGGVHYRIGAMVLSSSISIDGYSLPFNYRELFTSGGYHLVDTLDSFYTIVNGEQVWVHITDSTYVPLESKERLFDRTNKFGMLNARFSFAYDVYMENNYSIFVLAGMQIGFPVWQRGNTIVDLEEYPAIPMVAEELHDFVYGYHAGTGVRARLNNELDLLVSATYQRHLNEMFRSHPLNRRFRGMSLQAGIQYYL